MLYAKTNVYLRLIFVQKFDHKFHIEMAYIGSEFVSLFLFIVRRTSHFSKKINQRKNISLSCIKNIEHENPISRTIRILGNDLKRTKNWLTQKSRDNDQHDGNDIPESHFPSHCDIVIIGGGAIGSSIAYALKEKAADGLSIVVVERDPTYKTASTTLSVGGLRQQFSLPENILMSLYGAEFLRNVPQLLGNDINISFTPFGYLTLASEEGADQLKENFELQQSLGAKSELLTAKGLKKKFPWLDVNGIVLGCHGLEKEGWFDPWALLYGFKKKAIELGVEYLQAEAQSFEFDHKPDMLVDGVEPGTYQGLNRLLVKQPNGDVKPIKFAICIIAAGPHSGKVAEAAKIGKGEGLLRVPLPIEPRKRYVYCYECKNADLGINIPLVIDPTGTYFRREGLGGMFIGGRSPEPKGEPDNSNLEVDYEYFNDYVWPVLAKRVPAFEAIKLRSAWAGYYEYNWFDENGIVGPHPYYTNLYIAAGFSGHGIQHSPAVGRAVAEMILYGEFKTIDLTRFGFDRILLEKKILETGIV